MRGFSIIELLVVIVIIGLIATIAMININGTQITARNSTRIQTAEQVNDSALLLVNDLGASGVKALLNGTAPNYTATCLGKSYVDSNGDGKGDCVKNGATVISSESSALLTQLQKVSNPPLAKDMPAVTSGTTVFYGPTIGTAIIDGGSPSLILEYKLEKDTQDCKLSPVIYLVGGVYSRSQTGSPAYSASGSGYTTCILSLEN